MQVATTGLIVRNARVHPTQGRPVDPSDVLVDGDRIAAIRPAGEIAADGRPEFDAEGRLLSPPLVDPHVHMDAVLTVGEPRHNESGTLIEGILTWADRKPSLTHEDVKTRAREAIMWEVAQGTGLIRSHVDVCDPSLTALRALIELRDEVRDIVELRLIAFPQDGILSFPNGKELMREAMRLGLRRHRRHPALRVDPRGRRRGGPLPVRPRARDRRADRPPLRRDRRRAVALPGGRRRPNDARRDAGPGGCRPHDGDGLVQRRLCLQAPPDPEASRGDDRREPARQHRPPGPLRHVSEAAGDDPRQGARRGRRQCRLRPRFDHGSVVPAGARVRCSTRCRCSSTSPR